VVKALALTEWSPQEIEITGGRGGPPGVRLHGRAAARAAELDCAVEVSLTHSRGTAAAVAVLR
jgi:phosphopantetheinyl transferase (holo-ACP synthase)